MQGKASGLTLGQDDRVTGGMVAETLTLMAAGKCHLKPGHVKVRCSISHAVLHPSVSPDAAVTVTIIKPA